MQSTDHPAELIKWLRDKGQSLLNNSISTHVLFLLPELLRPKASRWLMTMKHFNKFHERTDVIGIKGNSDAFDKFLQE